MESLLKKITHTEYVSNIPKGISRSSDYCQIKTLIIPRGTCLNKIKTLNISANGMCIFSQPFELLTKISISPDNFVIDVDIPRMPTGRLIFTELFICLQASMSFKYTICMLHKYDTMKQRKEYAQTTINMPIESYRSGCQITERTIGCLVSGPSQFTSLKIQQGSYLLYEYIRETLYIHEIKRVKRTNYNFIRKYANICDDLIGCINEFIGPPTYIYWIAVPPIIRGLLCDIIINNKKTKILYTQETNYLIVQNGCIALRYVS
jgi:hypothetical protein